MQVFIYDNEGLYIESKFVDEIEENMTTIPILVGHIKPKFDKELKEWVEGATQEEIKEWENKQSIQEQIIDPKDILIAELSISLAETQSQGAQAIAELTKAIAMLQTPIN